MAINAETLTPQFIKKCQERLLAEEQELNEWFSLHRGDGDSEGKRRNQERLQAVIDALGRIEKGSFGQCVACGQIIEEARLDGDPARPRCFGCESRRPSSSRRKLPFLPPSKLNKRRSPEKLYFH